MIQANHIDLFCIYSTSQKFGHTFSFNGFLTGTVCLAGMKVKCLEYSSIPLKYIPSEHISSKGCLSKVLSSGGIAAACIRHYCFILKSSTLCVCGDKVKGVDGW